MPVCSVHCVIRNAYTVYPSTTEVGIPLRTICISVMSTARAPLRACV